MSDHPEGPDPGSVMHPAEGVLDRHLAECQRDSGLTIGHDGPAMASFRDEIKENADLKAAVQRRLGMIDDSVLQRDHISRWLKDALERALQS